MTLELPVQKKVAEGLYRISIFKLNKLGFLKWTDRTMPIDLAPRGQICGRFSTVSNGGILNSLDVSYSSPVIEGELKNHNYSIFLRRTVCGLGGYRYWFECPYCKRRAGVLFMNHDGYFQCRICTGLAYRSQNESKRFRAPMYRTLVLGWKLETLRTRFYRGKPTKKYASILRRIPRLIRG